MTGNHLPTLQQMIALAAMRSGMYMKIKAEIFGSPRKGTVFIALTDGRCAISVRKKDLLFAQYRAFMKTGKGGFGQAAAADSIALTGSPLLMSGGAGPGNRCHQKYMEKIAITLGF